MSFFVGQQWRKTTCVQTPGHHKVSEENCASFSPPTVESQPCNNHCVLRSVHTLTYKIGNQSNEAKNSTSLYSNQLNYCPKITWPVWTYLENFDLVRDAIKSN